MLSSEQKLSGDTRSDGTEEKDDKANASRWHEKQNMAVCGGDGADYGVYLLAVVPGGRGFGEGEQRHRIVAGTMAAGGSGAGILCRPEDGAFYGISGAGRLPGGAGAGDLAAADFRGKTAAAGGCWFGSIRRRQRPSGTPEAQ